MITTHASVRAFSGLKQSPLVRHSIIRRALVTKRSAHALASSSSSSPFQPDTTQLSFIPLDHGSLKSSNVIVIGRNELMAEATAGLGVIPHGSLLDALTQGSAGDRGKTTSAYIGEGEALRHLSLVRVPSKASRHNAACRPDAVTSLFKTAMSAAGGGAGDVSVVAVLESPEHRHAVSSAIARALPVFTAKSTSHRHQQPPKTVRVAFADPLGKPVVWAQAAAATAAIDSAADATDSGESADSPNTAATHSASADAVEASLLEASLVASKAVRKAQELVDTPPEFMNVNAMVKEALNAIERLNNNNRDEQQQANEDEAKNKKPPMGVVGSRVLRGQELKEAGFGGLWGVGKAAAEPPALVVLSYDPPTPPPTLPRAEGAEGVEEEETAARRDKTTTTTTTTTTTETEGVKTVVWVGKGIVFDTGGLSLKVGGSMVGMKADMGGAAAMLAAFEGAVELRTRQRLRVVLCLAENSIGPLALRNDDVVKLFSGKTVEINNTDAEGRLVLGDGVALASTPGALARLLSSSSPQSPGSSSSSASAAHIKQPAAAAADDDDEVPDLIVDMATLTGAQVGLLAQCCF
jgi:probable aminopeptidase NPEPL1